MVVKKLVDGKTTNFSIKYQTDLSDALTHAKALKAAGPDITGKHIDVYTGIGAAADRETYRITGHDNTVCIS